MTYSFTQKTIIYFSIFPFFFFIFGILASKEGKPSWDELEELPEMLGFS